MQHSQTRAQKLISHFRTIPNYPIEGVDFKDICPILKDPSLLHESIQLLYEAIQHIEFDYLIALESRGFLFGTGLALKSNKGMILIRKPNKLPGEIISYDFIKEYGKDTFTMQANLIEQGKKCVIVDDVLATGGTIIAAAELIKKAGGIPVGRLQGKEKIKKLLPDMEIISLVAE